MVLKDTHPAVLGARTLFPSRVLPAQPDIALFKSGENSRKIGSHVTKGMWKGMPIYTLTLEERSTCPKYCEHWHDCFGNKMHWSTRWEQGINLEEKIDYHLGILAKKFPGGFVVRLHVLGDFYKLRYVQWWKCMMFEYPNLHVFGYTRLERDSRMGDMIDLLNKIYPTRWRVRWSERGGEMGTVTSEDVTLRGNTPQGIVCPAQTDDSDCCGTCGLCWNSSRPIVFLNH